MAPPLSQLLGGTQGTLSRGRQATRSLALTLRPANRTGLRMLDRPSLYLTTKSNREWERVVSERERVS